MARRTRMFRYGTMSRWSPQIALRRMNCRIEDAKAALADIAGIWGDVDQAVCDQADEHILGLDEFMAETREMVRQHQEAGEEIGL
jgi:phosphoserine phosphatase